MAKKRITQITVERTAFLTTDYFAIDSATGTNNTGRISGPNLLAQLANGPTSPTFQVKLSTLATAGLGGVSRLAQGFDIFGTNAKATTAAVENLFQVASSDAASPLALRFGIKTDATATSRNGIIEVDDAGTKRDLVLQPTGSGKVGIGISPSSLLHLSGPSANVIVNASGVGERSSISYLVSGSTKAIWGVSGGASDLIIGSATGDSVFRSTQNMLFSPDSGVTALLNLLNSKNVGIGTLTVGSGAVKVMAFGNGTEPAAIADAFQMLSKDIVAGNAAPHFVTEAGPVIRLYQQAHIADPAAGGTVDAEARTAINAILVALENTRLLAAA